MQRNYDFYMRKYNWSKEKVDNLFRILTDVENNNVNDTEVRSNGENLLHMCLCEGKNELFKKLISPFTFKTGEIVKNPTTLQVKERVRYHYLIDFFSLVDNGFFNRYPSSIMEAYFYYKKIGNNKSLEDVSEDIVIVSQYTKEEFMRSASEINLKVMNNMRIKDVLARQISGHEHPLKTKEDVKYYSELPTLLPSMDLFDLNIQTTTNDTGGCFNDKASDDNESLYETVIGIDYDSLSEYNKFIFNLLAAKGSARVNENKKGKKFYLLSCKANPKQDVSYVSDELTQIVSAFSPQDFLYGKVNPCDLRTYIVDKYTEIGKLDKLNLYINNNIDNNTLVRLVNEVADNTFIYDDTDDSIWSCQEDYLRHKNYVSTNKLGK